MPASLLKKSDPGLTPFDDEKYFFGIYIYMGNEYEMKVLSLLAKKYPIVGWIDMLGVKNL